MDRSVEVLVAGATGLVGRELLNALADAGHPPERVTALGSERSVGQELDYAGETLEVEKLAPEALNGRKLVLLALPPEVARPFGLSAQAAGAWVVDVSRAFAREAAVPVVVPSVNGVRLKDAFAGRIVRTPTAVGAAVLTALEPVRQQLGLRRVDVTGLLGASSQGVRGVDTLEKQTSGLLSGKELEEGPFPHRLAFNLIPQVGAFSGGERTEEELAWTLDALGVWGESPGVFGLAVQVPHFFGHAAQVCFETERDLTVPALQELFRNTPSLKLLDVPAERIYPMPSLAMADPTVLVGRVLASGPRRASVFVVVDNAGRGAALNALEVGQVLLARP